jgi:protein-disulfide isomerase
MKRYLPFAIIALVATVALGAGTSIYRTKHARIQAAAAAAELAAQSTIGKPGAKPPHIRGAAKAPVTFEEFGDFQCPPCSMLASTLHKIEHAYEGRVRVIFRHYPLANHKHARLAALAAEAAGMQGKFWEMHDIIYQNRVTWTSAPDLRPFIYDYARDIGLDATAFTRDLDSEQAKARVAADRERADSLGVNSTPTLFINDKLLPVSSFDEPGLRKEIETILNGQAPQ